MVSQMLIGTSRATGQKGRRKVLETLNTRATGGRARGLHGRAFVRLRADQEDGSSKFELQPLNVTA